jgi:hypothetical protein
MFVQRNFSVIKAPSQEARWRAFGPARRLRSPAAGTPEIDGRHPSLRACRRGHRLSAATAAGVTPNERRPGGHATKTARHSRVRTVRDFFAGYFFGKSSDPTVSVTDLRPVPLPVRGGWSRGRARPGARHVRSAAGEPLQPACARRLTCATSSPRSRHHIERLGDILTDLAEIAATIT